MPSSNDPVRKGGRSFSRQRAAPFRLLEKWVIQHQKHRFPCFSKLAELLAIHVQLLGRLTKIQTGVGNDDVAFLHKQRGDTAYQRALPRAGRTTNEERWVFGCAVRDWLHKFALNLFFKLLRLIALHEFQIVVTAMDHVTPFGWLRHKRLRLGLFTLLRQVHAIDNIKGRRPNSRSIHKQRGRHVSMIQDARGLAWWVHQAVVRRIELDEVVVDNASEATQRIRLLWRTEVTGVAEQ